MPDSQPQQPANEDQPAAKPPQSPCEQSRQADTPVPSCACDPAESPLNGAASRNAEAPLNGDAPPGAPGWLDDEEELSGLVLVPGSEPVPAGRVLLPEPAAAASAGVGGGLCWSFGVDLDAIQAAAARASAAGILPGMATAGHGGPAPDPAAPGGVLLPDEGGLGLDVAAEFLPGSAGLAAWLDQRDPAEASDYNLPTVAAGWRRVAAWAQAREFAAVAQIAARSAARNEKVGLAPDGRPAAVTLDAAAQVGLALVLSPGTAEWWTGQAITLTWRLPGTGAALAAGQIDAYRARLIIEATSLLDQDTARRVENDVLPEAGDLTYAQLRSRLRKAVIMADPEGAEERRKASERRARVSLYPDDDGTATLTGTSLPAPHAAAAMARITALARALKASGAGGGTDLLRAHIYLGLLLGTLPPIPPPADTGQPDGPTEDDPPPDDDKPPGGGGPSGPRGDGHHGGPPSRHGQPVGPPPGQGYGPGRPAEPGGGHARPGGTPPSDGQRPGSPRGSRPPRRQRPSEPPPHRDESPGRPADPCDEPAGRAGSPPPDAPHSSSPRGDGRTPAPDPGPRARPARRPLTPRPPTPRPATRARSTQLGTIPYATRSGTAILPAIWVSTARSPATWPPRPPPVGSRAARGRATHTSRQLGDATPSAALPSSCMPGDDGSVHGPLARGAAAHRR